MEVAQTADSGRVVNPTWLYGSAASAAFASLGLIWLILAGPGFMGHGASLLWAGAPREGMRAGFYDIVVAPGSKSVRKKSDQVVSAQLVGFDSRNATLFAKFEGTSKWEPAPMAPQPSGTGFEFLFAGLPSSVEYYVESNGVKSKNYVLTAIDLPGIKKLRVTYKYPKWAGLKDVVEEPGGDLRAIEGTEATVAIMTDKPLAHGVVILEDGSRIDMQKAEEGNWLTATVPIKTDGMYHIAAVEKSEDIRLSEDYFIEAQKEEPPKVRIARPGRDFKVNPIEEVTVRVEADDDFGLQDVVLSYSVNGGPEKNVSMLSGKGAKTSEGETVIALEDFKLQPAMSWPCTPAPKTRAPKPCPTCCSSKPSRSSASISNPNRWAVAVVVASRKTSKASRSAKKKSSPRPSTRFATRARIGRPRQRTRSSSPKCRPSCAIKAGRLRSA